MNYQEALDYLYHRLPMFTRDGAAAYKKDLTNTLALCGLLGDPQHQFRSIHIAGSNGKRSTSHSLAAILQESGYKTGLYTSPHLVDFRERIRINGQMIPEQWVLDFVDRNMADFERIKPSFFEVTVAMAFRYFADEQVDIAVIETGLGGRLDSTNVITPLLSLITNIGRDHTNILGNTLSEIAGEKAGIIKKGVPLVVSEYQEEVAGVFREKASDLNAELLFASERYHSYILKRSTKGQQILVSDLTMGTETTYDLDLPGTYQSKNLPGILAAVDQLRKLGWLIPDESLRSALSSVRGLTGLRGRWEILQTDPLLVCDTGHNVDGWKQILQNISLIPYRKLHIVLGVMADKDLTEMLPLLPVDAAYYFCQVDLPRALPANELAAKAAAFGMTGKYYGGVAEAARAAKAAAANEDLIFVGGSTFVVGDLLADGSSWENA